MVDNGFGNEADRNEESVIEIGFEDRALSSNIDRKEESVLFVELYSYLNLLHRQQYFSSMQAMLLEINQPTLSTKHDVDRPGLRCSQHKAIDTTLTITMNSNHGKSNRRAAEASPKILLSCVE